MSIKKQKAKNLFKRSYDEILVLLAKEEFFPQLRDELFKEYGDVRRYIKDGIKDLYDDSCPIVVTGIELVSNDHYDLSHIQFNLIR